MAVIHCFILLQLALSLVLQSSGLMSDHKTCGDHACARLMCRVQALRDHRAQDCRFLSFKKGDMIDVYHKLTRRKTDLWAGSIDKQFGYFPKDAVKIDEVFVDERKEIEMSTQKTDFFCTDAFGTIITSGEEFEDYEFGAQIGETEDLGNSDFDDRVSKASEQNENVKTRHIDKNDKDRREAGESGSSWIGAALSGWFANDAEETGNGNEEQDQFKVRKLALDLEQLNEEEERPAQLLDWNRDGLTNTFGIGKNVLQPQSKDQTEHNEDPPNEHSSYLLGNGIKHVLGFGGGDTPPSETRRTSQDEKMKNLMEQQEAMSPKVEKFSETSSEKEKGGDQMDAGWYDSFYNRITNLYGDSSSKSETSKAEGKDSLSNQGMDEDKVMISDENPKLRSESFLDQDSQNDRNTANREEKQEVTGQEQEVASRDHSDETSQLGKGYERYESVLNRITEINGESPNGKDAPHKSDVIEGDPQEREDPQETSETSDPLSSREEKLEHGEHAAENMNAGWYDRVYSRISNMYGDMSEEHQTPDGMEDVESRTQSENTKDTSSPSIFSINGLTSVIDSLRSPSKGAGSVDETRLSGSVTSEPSLTQSHVHDTMTLQSDDDHTEKLGLTETENTDKRPDADQSPDTTQLSMINKLKSPFKPNDAEDQEKSDEGKTSEEGKEGKSANDESVTDDELSVRSTDVISKGSSQKAVLVSEEEEEEEVVLEVNVAEAQKNTEASSLDRMEQDMSDDGEKICTDIHAGLNDQHEDINEFSSGSAILSTDHNMNMTSGLNPDEVKTLAEELSWPEVPEHVSDMSESREGETNSHDANKSISEKNGFVDVPGGEDSQSESKTRSDSGLRVAENSSETVDGSEEAQDEVEAAEMLHEAEEAGMKMSNGERGQSIHMASNDEKHSGDGGVEHGGELESENITLTEYDEETEGGDIVEMENHEENKGADFTQTESGGDKEGGAPRVGFSKGQEDGDVAQIDSGGGNKSGAITQVEDAGGHEGAEIESDEETESVNIVPVESGAASDGEKEGKSLQTAHGLENISESKQDLELTFNDSRESKKCESSAAKQSEITPDKSPSADSFENERPRTSYGDQSGTEKTNDVKHHKAHTQKRVYPNLQAHLCEEDIQALLKFFSEEILSWLDFTMEHFEHHNNKELAELQDFEKTLEHLLKSKSQELEPSLQYIQSVLVMLRKTFIPVKADGSVDKSTDLSQTECGSEACESTNANTPISEKAVGQDNDTENNTMDENTDHTSDTSSAISDSDSLISKSLSNDQDVLSEKTPVSDYRDTLKSEQKTAPQPDPNIITAEFLEPEESQNEAVLYPYTLLITEFTSDALTYVVKESERVKHTLHEVGTGSRSTISIRLLL